MRNMLFTTKNGICNVDRGVRSLISYGCMALLLLSCHGCGGALSPPGGDAVDPGDPLDPIDSEIVDGNRDASATSPAGKTSGEPNDLFSQAVVAVFDSSDKAELQGSVSVAGDLDIYQLGVLTAGDRVVIDTATAGSDLDISIAVFDDQERLVYASDDRGGPPDRFLDSFADWIVRHSGSSYYLVLTHSAFAASGTFTGTYTVDVFVFRGLGVPTPTPQILVLDFDGASVDSPTLGQITVPSFDASAISPIYQNDTQTIKETIRAVFEQNFERFNVTIITTDDTGLPSESDASRIYFGGFDAQAFGIAENVDVYNADLCDDAIIFTESFSTRVFSFAPTAEEMGTAIGNVACHEAGHLLGLNHVDDDRALMDDQSAADAFLDDQEFMEAPLSGDIMRIGTQDAALLLVETVGPSDGASLKRHSLARGTTTKTPAGLLRPLPSPLVSKRRSSRIGD